MIDTAISHIAGELNQFLKQRFTLDEDVVVVSNILEQDGTVASHVNNKIVVSLVNIQKDTVPFQQQKLAAAGQNRSVVSNAPVFFNLYLMFASYFSGNNYQEGLKFISSTISYFQGQPVFDHTNSPQLSPDIDKLVMDIENLSIDDLSGLWGVLSGKYLPSILYKVRMVTCDSGSVVKQDHALSQTKQVLGSP